MSKTCVVASTCSRYGQVVDVELTFYVADQQVLKFAVPVEHINTGNVRRIATSLSDPVFQPKQKVFDEKTHEPIAPFQVILFATADRGFSQNVLADSDQIVYDSKDPVGCRTRITLPLALFRPPLIKALEEALEMIQ
jgi:hypothetical protein